MADRNQQGGQSGDSAETNIGNVERVVSSLVGVRMLLDGLYRPSLLRMIIGSALVCRGVTGHSALYGVLGLDTSKGLEAIGGHERRAAARPSGPPPAAPFPGTPPRPEAPIA
jgi:hypothetical protein